MNRISLALLLLVTLMACEKDDQSTTTATSDVVINELQPSNTSTAQDSSLQFDDWIELYNRSSSAIDISGFFLTDNDNNLTRWRIPDGTTIEGNGYLIVWADADLNQIGLHADFKLSSKGEEVLLINGNMQIVDQVKFDEQVGETSYARKPNGTGDFVWGTPSFNAMN